MKGRCVMANDETRTAERIIAMPPSSWDDHPETMISIARVIARAYLAQRAELDRLRAEVAELVAAIQKYSVYAQARGSAPFGTTAEEQAALARHDAGKGGGE